MPSLGSYNLQIIMEKKLRVMGSMTMRGGIPKCIPLACLPRFEYTIPASTLVCKATPESLLGDNIVGLVIFAHGLSDGPCCMCHMLERLAGAGFIVVAPSFSDDAGNDALCVAAHGREHLVENNALRIQVVQACEAAIRSAYGALRGLPTALIGYSVGSDTVRHAPMAGNVCPRVYIGGPTVGKNPFQLLIVSSPCHRRRVGLHYSYWRGRTS